MLSVVGKCVSRLPFSNLKIIKMEKMPFIKDPRYSDNSDNQYKVHQQIREDVSMTHRAPYPQEHEINLPRFKMNS